MCFESEFELKGKRVELSGRRNGVHGDGTTVSRQVAQLAHCSVPVADHRIYPEKYIKTKSVHCQICGSRNNEAFMLLCDTCNKGFHTFCFDIPMQKVPTEKWNCEAHEVKT